MTKSYYNNNDLYGDAGPHEAESKDALVEEMEETFQMWAEEEYEKAMDAKAEEEEIDKEDFIKEELKRMKKEFREALEEEP